MIGYHIAPRKRDLSFSAKKIGTNIITANKTRAPGLCVRLYIAGGGRETLAG